MPGQGCYRVSLADREPLNAFEQGSDIRHACLGDGQ